MPYAGGIEGVNRRYSQRQSTTADLAWRLMEAFWKRPNRTDVMVWMEIDHENGDIMVRLGNDQTFRIKIVEAA